MKALVVDDEAPARRRLKRLLQRCAEVSSVHEAGGGEAALAELRAAPPDVMFLDIRMPGLDGLALAAECAGATAVVFVTAHAEHAVRAYELDSVDYLLKPVRFERLRETVARVASRLRQRAAPGAAAPSIAAPVPRVVACERGQMVLASAHAITRFWSSDKYTAFRLDGREHLTEESLGSLERRLEAWGFVRVHRSELVRLTAVEASCLSEGVHTLRLSDGQVAQVSRRMAGALRATLRAHGRGAGEGDRST